MLRTTLNMLLNCESLVIGDRELADCVISVLSKTDTFDLSRSVMVDIIIGLFVKKFFHSLYFLCVLDNNFYDVLDKHFRFVFCLVQPILSSTRLADVRDEFVAAVTARGTISDILRCNAPTIGKMIFSLARNIEYPQGHYMVYRLLSNAVVSADDAGELLVSISSDCDGFGCYLVKNYPRSTVLSTFISVRGAGRNTLMTGLTSLDITNSNLRCILKNGVYNNMHVAYCVKIRNIRAIKQMNALDLNIDDFDYLDADAFKTQNWYFISEWFYLRSGPISHVNMCRFERNMWTWCVRATRPGPGRAIKTMMNKGMHISFKDYSILKALCCCSLMYVRQIALRLLLQIESTMHGKKERQILREIHTCMYHEHKTGDLGSKLQSLYERATGPSS